MQGLKTLGNLLKPLAGCHFLVWLSLFMDVLLSGCPFIWLSRRLAVPPSVCPSVLITNQTQSLKHALLSHSLNACNTTVWWNVTKLQSTRPGSIAKLFLKHQSFAKKCTASNMKLCKEYKKHMRQSKDFWKSIWMLICHPINSNSKTAHCNKSVASSSFSTHVRGMYHYLGMTQ